MHLSAEKSTNQIWKHLGAAFFMLDVWLVSFPRYMYYAIMQDYVCVDPHECAASLVAFSFVVCVCCLRPRGDPVSVGVGALWRFVRSHKVANTIASAVAIVQWTETGEQRGNAGDNNRKPERPEAFGDR